LGTLKRRLLYPAANSTSGRFCSCAYYHSFRALTARAPQAELSEERRRHAAAMQAAEAEQHALRGALAAAQEAAAKNGGALAAARRRAVRRGALRGLFTA